MCVSVCDCHCVYHFVCMFLMFGELIVMGYEIGGGCEGFMCLMGGSLYAVKDDVKIYVFEGFEPCRA